MKFVDAVLHVFYIQFASACILSESNSSKNDAFSHCRGYCKPLQYKLFQSTTLYVHLAVMQTKAFNVVNVFCLKIPFLPLCLLQIFHLVFTLLSKEERKENKKCLYRHYKRKHPLQAPPPDLPSLHPHAPPTVSPLSGCSSGLSCLLVHSREAAEIKSACYHLADVQKLDLKKILRGHCCHLLPLAPEQICSGFSQHPPPHGQGAHSQLEPVEWPGWSSANLCRLLSLRCTY